MQNFDFKGMRLTESDMLEIKEHYELQTIADGIREDHSEWAEDKIQTISVTAKENIEIWGVRLSEDSIIRHAIDEYEAEYEEVLEVE